MKTKIILEKISLVETMKAMFGATKEFTEEYKHRIAEIGEAICLEKGINKEEAMSLPSETELNSEKVIILFNDLCQWLGTQHPDLKP